MTFSTGFGIGLNPDAVVLFVSSTAKNFVASVFLFFSCAAFPYSTILNLSSQIFLSHFPPLIKKKKKVHFVLSLNGSV